MLSQKGLIGPDQLWVSACARAPFKSFALETNSPVPMASVLPKNQSVTLSRTVLMRVTKPQQLAVSELMVYSFTTVVGFQMLALVLSKVKVIRNKRNVHSYSKAMSTIPCVGLYANLMFWWLLLTPQNLTICSTD